MVSIEPGTIRMNETKRWVSIGLLKNLTVGGEIGDHLGNVGSAIIGNEYGGYALIYNQ